MSIRSEQRSPQRRARRQYKSFLEMPFAEHAPTGMLYQWKRRTVFGQEDRAHMINTEFNGWTPVPMERHKEFFGSYAAKGGPIEYGGLMLMEAPIEQVVEARQEEKAAAEAPVKNQMQRLGIEGRRSGVRASVKSSVEALPGQVVDD